MPVSEPAQPPDGAIAPPAAEAFVPPPPPPGPSRLDLARLRVRQTGWAIALGVAAVLLASWVAGSMIESIAAVAEAVAAMPEGRAATAVALQGLIAAGATLVVTLLGGLAVELPAAVGAVAGLLAVALPAVVIAVAVGLEQLLASGPAARLLSAIAAAAAGVVGLRLARTVLRCRR